MGFSAKFQMQSFKGSFSNSPLYDSAPGSPSAHISIIIRLELNVFTMLFRSYTRIISMVQFESVFYFYYILAIALQINLAWSGIRITKVKFIQAQADFLEPHEPTGDAGSEPKNDTW